jgi:hypothetical protein
MQLLSKAAAMEPSERAIQMAVHECAAKQRDNERKMKEIAKNMFAGKPLSPP